MPEQGAAVQSGSPMMYVDAKGNAQFVGLNGLPQAAVQVENSSGNVANSAAVATMAADATRTNYITGFEVTASGSTAGLPVSVTVAGILGGSLTYTFTFPAGVLVAAQPLTVEFPEAIPASAINTAITVTCPAGGAGNTNTTVNVHGFKV